MIDSHCHLDHEPLFSNISNIIKRSKDIGIEKILTICTTPKSFENIKKIVHMDEIIFGTYGIHPHDSKDFDISADDIVKNVRENDKIIGVGETGLDFFYNNSEKKKKIISFENHIQASITLNVPIIIHSRNAEDETINILNNFKSSNLKILMHCFTGSKNLAIKLFELNAYFSASGIITFKNSADLQETFKTIPLNRLLIETDSPFLAPEPMRGKKNEPSFVRFTLKKLSELKSIDTQELDKITTDNFNRLFFNT